MDFKETNYAKVSSIWCNQAPGTVEKMLSALGDIMYEIEQGTEVCLSELWLPSIEEKQCGVPTQNGILHILSALMARVNKINKNVDLIKHTLA